MKDKSRPRKDARPIQIDDETWWYFVGKNADNVIVWSPTGEKSLVSGNGIHFVNEDNASFPDTHYVQRSITPFKVRLYIDKYIRNISEEEINLFLKNREERFEKERVDRLKSLKDSVLERAEYLTNSFDQNDKFIFDLKHLLRLIK